MSDLDDRMMSRMADLVFEEQKPFCYGDFSDLGLKYSTYRKKICQFKAAGKVEFSYRSGYAYHTLKGHPLPKRNSVTLTQILGKDNNIPGCLFIYKAICSLPFQPPAVHDIRLTFGPVVGLHAKCLQTTPANAYSKDLTPKQLTFPVDGRKFQTKIHATDTVSVIIGCTYRPVIIDDVPSMLRLVEGLAQTSTLLRTISGLNIPHYSQRTVSLWHFGVDSLTHYSGQPFEVSWEAAETALIRIYTKDFPNRIRRVRAECVESPKQTLAVAVSQKGISDTWLPAK